MSSEGAVVFREGDYVALAEAGSEAMTCVIISEINPRHGVIVGTGENRRQFNREGKESFKVSSQAAHLYRLTPERESLMSAALARPELGSLWWHDDSLYEVYDTTNDGSDRHGFLPSVSYRPARPQDHGMARYSRTLVRWHARMVPATACEARKGSGGSACARCKRSWDHGEAGMCPIEA